MGRPIWAIELGHRGLKRCSLCGLELPFVEFAKSKKGDGRQARCLICDRVRKHNLTRNEWLAQLEKQGGKCAFPACERLPLEVDHDHRCCPTGKKSCGKCFRAILCSKHNMALGQFGDNVENLRDAIAYLRDFERCIWEILVPSTTNSGKVIEIDYHRQWDDKVRAISGGLTILGRVKGQWVHQGNVFEEQMIPCRVLATTAEMEKIVAVTQNHYSDQISVLAYRLGEGVILKHKNP
jgi:hypothetical protein